MSIRLVSNYCIFVLNLLDKLYSLKQTALITLAEKIIKLLIAESRPFSW